MKVFICWSGERSKSIASNLRDWLPRVIQQIDPWMSDEDITKGKRWATELSVQLGQTNFGIACLTPDNKNSDWMLFETGALAKQIQDSHVVPYLTQLTPKEITGPYTLFQMTDSTKLGTEKLIIAINEALETPLPISVITPSFEKWWPDLEKELKAIEDWRESSSQQRNERSILEEILIRVRDLPRELIQRDDGEPDLEPTDMKMMYSGTTKGYYLGQLSDYYESMARQMKAKPSFTQDQFIVSLNQYDHLFLRDLRDLYAVLPASAYPLAVQFLEDFLVRRDALDGPNLLEKTRSLL